MSSLSARLAVPPRELTARLAALPQRRLELAQDTGLALALSAVNVVSLLPYRDQLHPLWLALLLVVAQAFPLAVRRAAPVRASQVNVPVSWATRLSSRSSIQAALYPMPRTRAKMRALVGISRLKSVTL